MGSRMGAKVGGAAREGVINMEGVVSREEPCSMGVAKEWYWAGAWPW